jgi:hypothetical protein
MIESAPVAQPNQSNQSNQHANRYQSSLTTTAAADKGFLCN